MDITVIVPCRNEANHIDSFFDSLSKQTLQPKKVFIALAPSTDGTMPLLKSYALSFPSLTILDNPDFFVSSGLNLALSYVDTPFVVRMDMHTKYHSSYLSSIYEILSSTDYACVGGPWRPVRGHTFVEQTISFCFSSSFYFQKATSRNVDYSGPVDSIYLGAWPTSLLVSVGGFDPAFIRNQDDELSFRIRQSGGTLYQSSSIVCSYFPRSTYTQLFKQYFQYGYWKFHVLAKHKSFSSLRLFLFTLVLVIFALSLFFSVIGLLSPAVLLSLFEIYFLYLLFSALLANVAYSYSPIIRLSSIYPSFLSHISYAIGFCYAPIARINLFTNLRSKFTESLTR